MGSCSSQFGEVRVRGQTETPETEWKVGYEHQWSFVIEAMNQWCQVTDRKTGKVCYFVF